MHQLEDWTGSARGPWDIQSHLGGAVCRLHGVHEPEMVGISSGYAASISRQFEDETAEIEGSGYKIEPLMNVDMMHCMTWNAIVFDETMMDIVAQIIFGYWLIS